MDKICGVCGSIFYRKKKEGTMDWNLRKFCSLECGYIGRKTRKGQKNSLETRRKISISARGNKWCVGRIYSPETLLKMSLAKKGRQTIGMLGKKHKPETIKLIKEKLFGLLCGENNPNWRGGKSFEPYSPLWTRKLKLSILSRDDFKCQICGCPSVESKLVVHHIDYDKKNCCEDNLISLCFSCHSKTNFNREHWIDIFKLETRTA